MSDDLTSKVSVPSRPVAPGGTPTECDGVGARRRYTRADAEREVYAAILRAVRRDMAAEIEAGERLYREKKTSRSGLAGWDLLTATDATRDALMELRVRAGEVPKCRNFSPPNFEGRWRDWHRGHGCDKDDGKPRSAEGSAEIAGLAGIKGEAR